MNLSAPFIRRPVATTLLTVAVVLAGLAAFGFLPISPLPPIDFPAISVSASLPGASPEIMASSVATPLERQFGRIAGVTEMTSSSTQSQTGVTLLFDPSRDINGAAREVQAAISAARGSLPSNLPGNPVYRKVNPADAPIMILTLTSSTVAPGALYDAASTVLLQKLSQIKGVGQVIVGGSSLPAVRIDVNPMEINSRGLQLEDVRQAIAAQTTNQPKGTLQGAGKSWSLHANDQLLNADDYGPLVVAYRHGSAVLVSDIATVSNGVENIDSIGLSNGQPSAVLIIFRQPGANIITAVDAVKAALPQLKASIDPGIGLNIVMDQSVTIRASVHDVERSLFMSVGLVVLVVFVFLRDARATLIPTVAVPASLIGTFAVMHLLGYNLDNFSLMALTISTGFVVDDAIVVLENITRYRELGEGPMDAALKGAAEVGFTVLSMSLSLVAVFLPIMLMSGIGGLLFREFAVTLCVTILISLAVSLTTTPMMCAWMLRAEKKHGKFYQASERLFARLLAGYERTLTWALDRSPLLLVIFLGTVALNIFLFIKVPKGFFPESDTGAISGSVQGQQNVSFQAMKGKLIRLMDIVRADPAVEAVTGFSGGGGGTTTNTARMFITLKPLTERKKTSVQQVITRLRPKLALVPGATLFLQAVQDVRVGGRAANAEYQYTIQADTLPELNHWAPLLLAEMKKLPGLTDVSSDQQDAGLEAALDIDRMTAARLGITSAAIDNTLYDAFGQRQIATRYTALNQYHVVMEVAPEFWQSPAGLGNIYLTSTQGGQVPLAAFTHYAPSLAPLAVAHQGQFPATTISFNLGPGVALGQAVKEIDGAKAKLGMPATLQTNFAGTALAFQSSESDEGVLIIGALAAIYVVLGILYESYIHPITILSTLPPAGVGALLALLIAGSQLTLIAIIGILLLIGLVKKNAIMMVDFALMVERKEGKSSREAIYQAAQLRFRPILMTTMAALLGALPLALGQGQGSELRRPLGIAIVGGLIVSQVLTLYTTPVIYLYMDRLRLWANRKRQHAPAPPQPAAGAPAPAY
jgi:multidrug efflux pump